MERFLEISKYIDRYRQQLRFFAWPMKRRHLILLLGPVPLPTQAKRNSHGAVLGRFPCSPCVKPASGSCLSLPLSKVNDPTRKVKNRCYSSEYLQQLNSGDVFAAAGGCAASDILAASAAPAVAGGASAAAASSAGCHFGGGDRASAGGGIAFDGGDEPLDVGGAGGGDRHRRDDRAVLRGYFCHLVQEEEGEASWVGWIWLC